MAKVEDWPYEVLSDKNDKRVFTPMTFTIKEITPAKDVVGKNDGKNYHFPPQAIFLEDPQADEWGMNDWTKEGVKFDWNGLPDGEGGFYYPAAGTRITAKLKTSAGYNGRVFRDVDVSSIAVLNSNIANDAPRPSEPEPEPEFKPAPVSASQSTIEKLSTQQQISATALANVLAPKVWDDTPDDPPWKKQMKEFIYAYTPHQIPPTLRDKVIESVEVAEEPVPVEESVPVEAAETVEELPW